MQLHKGDEPIPGYRLEKFLGRGQFGEVWRTTAPGGTAAALKFIDLSGVRGIKEFRGVQRVKDIRHAHLMPITAQWMLDADGALLRDELVRTYDPAAARTRATLDAAEADDSQRPQCLVVAMLLADKSLEDRLREARAAGQEGVPLEELLGYMEEAAKGIDFLNSPQHDLGEGPVAIQHCDIKPANMMLVGDSIVICDFGLARVLASAQVTATSMVGSPAYMAPEAIACRPGRGTDQYALAVSYHELRTGELPFKDESYFAVLEAHRSGTLDLSRLTPAETEVIRRATAVDPQNRYPSALDMVHALRRAVTGAAEAAPSPPRPRPGWRSAVLAAVVLLAVGGAAWWAARTFGPDGPPPVGPVAPRTCALHFEPPDCQVTINDQPCTLDRDGRAQVELAADATVRIVARHADGYEELRREYTFAELERLAFRLRLERAPAYFVDQAWTLLDGNDLRGAVQQYQQAIQHDRRFAAAPPPVVLGHHAGAIRVLAVSPDSRWLASAADDKSVCLWTLAASGDRAEPVVLAGHNETVDQLVFRPDSRGLVSASWDAALVWDLTREPLGREPARLAGQESDITALALSPDGRWLATGGADNLVRLWRLDGPSPSAAPLLLKGHAEQIRALAISPDARWLVSVCLENKLLRWDLSSAQPADTATPLGTLAAEVRSLVITPEQRLAMAVNDAREMLLVRSLTEPQSPPQVLRGHGDAVEKLALTEDGHWLASASVDYSVRVWDLTAADPSASSRKFAGSEGHTDAVVDVAFSRDGSWLVSGSWDGSLRLWERDQPDAPPLLLTAAATADRPPAVNVVALSPDGRWVIAGTADGQLLRWDLRRCQVIKQARDQAGVSGQKPVET